MWCNLDAKRYLFVARAHLYYVVIITAIYYHCNIIIYNNSITGACIQWSGIPFCMASCVKSRYARRGFIITHRIDSIKSMSFGVMIRFYCLETQSILNRNRNLIISFQPNTHLGHWFGVPKLEANCSEHEIILLWNDLPNRHLNWRNERVTDDVVIAEAKSKSEIERTACCFHSTFWFEWLK